MPNLGDILDIENCPHCGVTRPMLRGQFGTQTQSFDGNSRHWVVYSCSRCGGLVSAVAATPRGEVIGFFPALREVASTIPSPARRLIQGAVASLHTPDGCILLCASAIDAMLKIKGYEKGTLNERIGQAANNHLITAEMAEWAHDVRLDANDSRHVDAEVAAPPPEDAKKCLDFTEALAEFLFVLPARVERGRRATPLPKSSGDTSLNTIAG